MASHFFVPLQHASQYILPEKLTRIHWLLYDHTVPSLNSLKILTVQSVENLNFLNLPVFGLPVGLLACHPYFWHTISVGYSSKSKIGIKLL